MLKVTLEPTATVWLIGCVPISGGGTVHMILVKKASFVPLRLVNSPLNVGKLIERVWPTT